jgi:hypothetical protein
MFELISFILKLILFFVSGCTASLLISQAIQYNRLKQLYPFISFAFLPFFLGFKGLEVLGKQSFSPVLYNYLSLALIVFLVLAFLSKRINAIIRKSAKILWDHKIFLLVIFFLFLFFILQGTYLEYPADPVTYLGRIGLSNQDTDSNWSALWKHNTNSTFFNSFQQWLVGSGPSLRYKLDVLVAFTKCLVLIAVYKATYALSRRKDLGVYAALLMLGYHGNQEISELLYKDLNGAILGWINYSELMPILGITYTFRLRLLTPRILAYLLSYIFVILVMMQDSHRQMILFIIVLVFGVGFWHLLKPKIHKMRVSHLYLICSLLLLIPFIYLFLSDREFIAYGNHQLPAYLHEAYGYWRNQVLLFYWPNEPNSSFNLLDYTSIFLAIILLLNTKANSVNFFLAAANLSAYVVFFNPLVTSGLLKIVLVDAFHRIMHTGQPWLFLPLACQYLSREFKLKLDDLVKVVLVLSLVPIKPIYGKVIHLLNLIPTYADGRDLQPIVTHLFNSGSISQDRSQPDQKVQILADPYVNSYLGSWPQLGVLSPRELHMTPGHSLYYIFNLERNFREIEQFLIEFPVDYLILNDRQITYTSWIGQHIQHWPADFLATLPQRFPDEKLKEYITLHPEQFELELERNGFLLYQVKPMSVQP